MDALRVPLAVKILIGVGLLVGVNELAPGIAPTILVLVAIYLVLTQTDKVNGLITGASAGFASKLRPSAADPRAGR